jgi:BRCT domain type II-containing protein
VVAGDNMGPAKRQKAEKLGVRIIDEGEFMAMIVSAERLESKTDTTEISQIVADKPIQGTLF